MDMGRVLVEGGHSMSRRRRRSLLVPEARQALDQLRNSVIVEKSAPSNHLTQGENAWTAVNSAASGTRSPVQQERSGPSVAGVANAVGVPYQQGDNGNLTTRQAGKIGGQIGGSMVQRLISIAEQELAKESNPPRNT